MPAPRPCSISLAWEEQRSQGIPPQSYHKICAINMHSYFFIIMQFILPNILSILTHPPSPHMQATRFFLFLIIMPKVTEKQTNNCFKNLIQTTFNNAMYCLFACWFVVSYCNLIASMVRCHIQPDLSKNPCGLVVLKNSNGRMKA